jgi:glycosyltransferase involved in cell wall biosynthesis
MTKISVITPCFNEEINVKECYERLRKVMETDLSRYQYEHIFCDNASTDSTVEILRQVAKLDKRVKVIVNSRNVGPFRNMWNAMKSASGEIIIPLLRICRTLPR